MMKKKVLICEAPFDLKTEHDELKSAGLDVGAITTFVGTVRDINQDDKVRGLHLEHYPGMTERELDKILNEAASRWSLIAATVIHRIGDLLPGDEIVFVGIASEHRGDAFKSCEFVMDYLKTRATFWKKETTNDGERWLETRETDVAAAKSWQDSPGN